MPTIRYPFPKRQAAPAMIRLEARALVLSAASGHATRLRIPLKEADMRCDGAPAPNTSDFGSAGPRI
jgi:hypothetical protein